MEFVINKIDSSVVKGISYNKKRELTVMLIDRLYTYEKVPRKLAMEFVNAESKGKFYNQYIKDEFDVRD